MSEPPSEQPTPTIKELPHSRLILVLCRAQELESIREEFKDWQDVGLHLITYGKTHKANHGYLFCAWRGKPVPRAFMDKLREDRDIIDYIPINLIVPFSFPNA